MSHHAHFHHYFIQIKKQRFLLPALILILTITLSLSASAAINFKKVKTTSGGKFITQSNGSWWYRYSDGSYCKKGLYKIDDKIYYFSKQGYRYYGWQTVKGTRYYFGTRKEGYLYQEKWICDEKNDFYYLGTDGLPVKGVQTIGEKEFFFDSETGLNKYGWQKVGKKKYFYGYHGDSYKRTNTLIHSGKSYYFLNKSGQKISGWVRFQGEKYYFGTDKKGVTGRQVINNKVYTFDNTGKVIAQGADLTLSSECAILIDAKTGETLYEKRADMQHANASTTKIMTAILALEQSSLKAKVKVSAKAAAVEPTKMYLHTGELIYMKDLLYGLMLPSGNDAAIAIAEHISGSTSRFVTLMNKTAKKLGCTNTQFGSPNGLDNVNGVYFTHHTSARDLAIMAKYAMKKKTFRKIVAARTYNCRSISGYSYSLNTTNGLWGEVEGLLGIKTGHTKKAGYCFVGAVKGKDGHTYISVVLGAPTSSARWTDSAAMLNYALEEAAQESASLRLVS